MIALNTCFIKHSNGLFHYGLDYAEALGSSVREVWVRNPNLAEAAASRLPGRAIRVVSGLSLLRELRRAARRKDVVFTPSSHPLALGAKTVVVIHDSFPFRGTRGRLKRAIFRLGLRNPDVIAAYVNRSDALAFLETIEVPLGRTRYLPNGIGNPAREVDEPLEIGRELTIGLFGSDSDKKNYAALFAAHRRCTGRLPVRWLIYGHVNEYTRQLIEAFPQCAISVVSSDTTSLPEFLKSIDVVLSAATNEGFARPIALALQQGCPTLLVDAPVFREFYSGSARFLPDVDALVQFLAALNPGDRLERPSLVNAPDLRRAFADGVSWLAGQ